MTIQEQQLRAALPQIVAVVEAAELAMPYKDWDAGGNPHLAMPTREDLDDVRSALAALDEALT